MANPAAAISLSIQRQLCFPVSRGNVVEWPTREVPRPRPSHPHRRHPAPSSRRICGPFWSKDWHAIHRSIAGADREDNHSCCHEQLCEKFVHRWHIPVRPAILSAWLSVPDELTTSFSPPPDEEGHTECPSNMLS